MSVKSSTLEARIRPSVQGRLRLAIAERDEASEDLRKVLTRVLELPAEHAPSVPITMNELVGFKTAILGLAGAAAWQADDGGSDDIRAIASGLRSILGGLERVVTCTRRVEHLERLTAAEFADRMLTREPSRGRQDPLP